MVLVMGHTCSGSSATFQTKFVWRLMENAGNNGEKTLVCPGELEGVPSREGLDPSGGFPSREDAIARFEWAVKNHPEDMHGEFTLVEVFDVSVNYGTS